MVVARLNIGLPFSSVSSHYSCDTMALTITSYQSSSFFLQPSLKCWHIFKTPTCLAATSRNISSEPDSSPSQNPNSKPRRSSPRRQISKATENNERHPGDVLPITKPKKPRRGRKSEAAVVEDFLRDKLEQTLASIKEQNPEMFKDRKIILKERIDDDSGSNNSSDGADHDNGSVVNNMVVEQEDPNWPLDADVGWGTRASKFFEKYPIRNVVGEDGFEIDWEGEIDNGLVKEINCLEWESFAFHPSPLVVLVFERYNRSSENWKALKELEKAAEVYWKAKDRLPPRTIKLDVNIEKDLAYALKVKECPQILFLRGNQIMYREKEMRTAEELVQMIAYFYYNAKKPLCIK